MIDADRGSAGVVFCNCRCGHQVEGARPESVGRRCQGTDRADLDGVAGEVGGECVACFVEFCWTNGEVGASECSGVVAEAIELVVIVEAQDCGVKSANLLHGAAFLEINECVTGDLFGEAGASLTQDTPFSVEQDLGGDVDGFRGRFV